MTKSSVLLLPFAASSVSVARRRLVSDLVAAGIYEAAVSDAAVVISELFSNALRHARPLTGATIRVAWQLGAGVVRISVKDGGGPTLPEVGELSQSTTGGRGLRIVARLSKHWGSRCDDEGTTVWAEIAAPEMSQSGAPVRTATGLKAVGVRGVVPPGSTVSGDGQCHGFRGQTARSADYVALSHIDRA